MRKGPDTRCTVSYLDGVEDCDREWLWRRAPAVFVVGAFWGALCLKVWEAVV